MVAAVAERTGQQSRAVMVGQWVFAIARALEGTRALCMMVQTAAFPARGASAQRLDKRDSGDYSLNELFTPFNSSAYSSITPIARSPAATPILRSAGYFSTSVFFAVTSFAAISTSVSDT